MDLKSLYIRLFVVSGYNWFQNLIVKPKRTGGFDSAPTDTSVNERWFICTSFISHSDRLLHDVFYLQTLSRMKIIYPQGIRHADGQGS